jgi:uncharacterized surface protein with fasciclin (FAS1) repeats
MRSPSYNPDVYERLEENINLSIFTRLVNLSGLRNDFSSTIDITVFAPTNEAFEKVPKKTLDGLMGNKEALAKVIRYHVIDRIVPINDIPIEKETKLDTIYQGHKLSIYRHKNGGIEINRFNNVVGSGLPALNGMIYPLDGVMLPL